jgi:hypothetical protein
MPADPVRHGFVCVMFGCSESVVSVQQPYVRGGGGPLFVISVALNSFGRMKYHSVSNWRCELDYSGPCSYCFPAKTTARSPTSRLGQQTLSCAMYLSRSR